MMTNNTPWSHEVAKMNEKELNALICKIAGYKASFTRSWGPVLGLVDKKGFLRYPRFFTRTSKHWIVRESFVKNPISIHQRGPMALCQAIAITIGGIGKDYSGVV